MMRNFCKLKKLAGAIISGLFMAPAQPAIFGMYFYLYLVINH
ncbi:hypothetical protein C900_04140 [Fulvivirga imtechensis AK7]|uniref:Uncharacterized protein n=1 Tax=Fulvivirga imtechensis AK7 TaxID=1237149 RepID=L8JYQ2_9BACT|nr:hypothetical protein C900_04140 [Fulvivirga imtechensis AK7]